MSTVGPSSFIVIRGCTTWELSSPCSYIPLKAHVIIYRKKLSFLKNIFEDPTDWKLLIQGLYLSEGVIYNRK